LLGEQIITVVPQGNQTKIMDGRVRGSAITDHYPHLAAQSREEGPISGSGARFGHEHDETRGTESLSTGSGESIKISLVRRDDHRASTALGARPGSAG
jgi:hypothetical protein